MGTYIVFAPFWGQINGESSFELLIVQNGYRLATLLLEILGWSGD